MPGVRIRGGAFLFLLALLAALPSPAQNEPRLQVFAGYSYLRFDSKAFGFANSSNLNGYTISPAFNIIRGLGVVGELSGQYGSHVNLRDVTFGPQFLYPLGKKLFFGHFLFGDSRTFVSVGTGDGSTARMYAGGGGMDWELSPRFSFRVIQADYLHTTLFQGTQNSFRISTGLVYHWHTLRKKRHKMPGT